MKNLLLLFAMLSAPLAYAETPPLDKLLDEISAAAKKNDEPLMRAKTKEAIAAYPKSARVFILLGDLTKSEGDKSHSNPQNAQMSYQLALASFQRATELEPANAEAQRKLGQSLLRLHSPVAALTALKHAENLDSKQPGLQESLAAAEAAIHSAKKKPITPEINKIESERRAAPDFFCWIDEIPGHTLGPNPQCELSKILLKKSGGK